MVISYFLMVIKCAQVSQEEIDGILTPIISQTIAQKLGKAVVKIVFLMEAVLSIVKHIKIILPSIGAEITPEIQTELLACNGQDFTDGWAIVLFILIHPSPHVQVVYNGIKIGRKVKILIEMEVVVL